MWSGSCSALAASAPPSTSASSMKTIGKPSRTTSPTAMVMPRTMPLCGAAITCSIFIASTMATCWPLRTASPTRDVDRDDRCPGSARRRPTEPSGPVSSGAVPPRPSLPARLHLRVMGEQRQRIAAFDPRTGEPAVACRRRARPRSVGVAAGGRKCATCSSTQRVWTLPRRNPDAPGWLRRNGMLVPTPSSRNSLSARVARPTAAAKSATGNARSPWRARS